MSFNYERKVWGSERVEPTPYYIQGLKLKNTLDDFANLSGRILDVGCGGGNMAKALKRYRPDLEVYGTDIAKKAIAVARKNPDGVRFSVATAENLPFSNNYFNAVTMYDVLEHVENQLVTLKEVKRVLKKGGLLHLYLPLDGQPGFLYSLYRKIGWEAKKKYTGHTITYSDIDASRIFKKAGFKIVKKRFDFHYFMSFFDLMYYKFIDLTEVKAKASLEGEIQENKNSFFSFLFNVFYRSVIFIGYIESLLLKNVAGSGCDYLLVKA